MRSYKLLIAYNCLLLHAANGYWATWGPWSVCSSNSICDLSLGTISRSRTCTNPPPQLPQGLNCLHGRKSSLSKYFQLSLLVNAIAFLYLFCSLYQICEIRRSSSSWRHYIFVHNWFFQPLPTLSSTIPALFLLFCTRP